MGLFDNIRNAAMKRQEHLKRATETLDKIAGPLEPDKYFDGPEGEKVPYRHIRPTLIANEALKLITTTQMERLISKFESKLWRDYNQSGAFEGDYTQEDIERQASEDVRKAEFHVIRNKDDFYLYMTPQYADIDHFVSVRTPIDLERVGIEIDEVVASATERFEKQFGFKAEEDKQIKRNTEIKNRKETKENFQEFDKIFKGEAIKKPTLKQEQENVVITALATMQKHGTYLPLSAIQTMIPANEFKELHAKSSRDDAFKIVFDEKFEPMIKNHPFNIHPFERPFTMETLNCEAFLIEAKMAFEEHLKRHESYNNTHGIDGASTTNALKFAISEIDNVLSKIKALNREGDDLLNEVDSVGSEKEKESFDEIENIKNSDIFDKNIDETNRDEEEKSIIDKAENNPYIGDAR
jgi:hypothetical protein